MKSVTIQLKVLFGAQLIWGVMSLQAAPPTTLNEGAVPASNIRSATMLKAPKDCIECFTIVKMANIPPRWAPPKSHLTEPQSEGQPSTLTRTPYRAGASNTYQREDPLAWRTKKITEITLRNDTGDLQKIRATAGSFKEGDHVYVLDLPPAR